MTLTLHVDGARWRAGQAAVAGAVDGLVPVVKGNGYGFGRALLAAECARQGARVVAVGTASEVDSVRAAYDGDVLVLQPHLPGIDTDAEAAAGTDDRVVRTVSTPEGVRALTGRRAVVELMTSMWRFGLVEDELAGLHEAVGRLRLEGFALHLPLAAPASGPGPLAEVRRAVELVRRTGLPLERLWVSHVPDQDLDRLRAELPGVELWARVGTRLWLGDPGAYRAGATVLAVHRLRRGQRYGYRQRKAPRDGHLVVVAGGTAHGIALAAPAAPGGLPARGRSLGLGGLEALGRALSPFQVGGAKRWFAEPPHMQVSMVWLPGVEPAPEVGSELDVDVRMPTTTFDRVLIT